MEVRIMQQDFQHDSVIKSTVHKIRFTEVLLFFLALTEIDTSEIFIRKNLVPPAIWTTRNCRVRASFTPFMTGAFVTIDVCADRWWDLSGHDVFTPSVTRLGVSLRNG